MKTKIITITVAALAVASLCLAESIGSSPKSGEAPGTLPEMRADLTKTQAQLQQALTRIGKLEQQVKSLEQATAKLQQEQKNFGPPRLVPLEGK